MKELILIKKKIVWGIQIKKKIQELSLVWSKVEGSFKNNLGVI
jgi:hypothetical protein